MARYPTLFKRSYFKDVNEMYSSIQRWGSVLVQELNSRDLQVNSKPSTNIYTVVTVTEIGRPQKGDIAYSASSGLGHWHLRTVRRTLLGGCSGVRAVC